MKQSASSQEVTAERGEERGGIVVCPNYVDVDNEMRRHNAAATESVTAAAAAL